MAFERSRQLATLVAALSVATNAASVGFEDAKLLASDGASGDMFGSSCSLSGDVAAVAAIGDDDNLSNSGSVYVYRWSGTSWAEEQKLLAADGNAGDRYGASVAVSGDVLFVGANANWGQAYGSGAAYAYRWDGASWGAAQKLLASDGAADDGFGVGISVSGAVALIGAPRDDDSGQDSGSAYVYRWDGQSWQETAKLLASDGAAGDEFGWKTSMSGDVVLVNARRHDGSGADSGAVYAYRWNGVSWVEEQKLTASDAEPGDWFGLSVSVSGDVAFVGAPFDDDNGSGSGSVYVFRWNGVSWVEEQKLLASDGAAGDSFGGEVSVSGDVALVVADWDDDNGSASGSAYLYRWDGLSWVEDRKLLPSDGAASDEFGVSASLSGNAALFGAWRDDDGGPDSGSAYVYGFSPCGDGVLDAGEACDDGARLPGDGCSGTCQVEACSNGLDDDGDGLIDYVGGDPGCWGPADRAEVGLGRCDNGIDDDGDGFIDAAEDPACSSGSPWAPDPTVGSETSKCQDGIDNDSSLGTDFDGGESILGIGAGDPDGPDPECIDAPWSREGKHCGLGPELAPVLLLLAGLRRRSRRRLA